MSPSVGLFCSTSLRWLVGDILTAFTFISPRRFVVSPLHQPSPRLHQLELPLASRIHVVWVSLACSVHIVLGSTKCSMRPLSPGTKNTFFVYLAYSIVCSSWLASRTRHMPDWSGDTKLLFKLVRSFIINDAVSSLRHLEPALEQSSDFGILELIRHEHQPFTRP